MGLLDPDRLFPPDPVTRGLARALYTRVRDLPIISPHGHTDARWFAEDAAFPDPAQLFVTPDHYVFRMLHSQGVSLADLGVPRADSSIGNSRSSTSSGIDPPRPVAVSFFATGPVADMLVC